MFVTANGVLVGDGKKESDVILVGKVIAYSENEDELETNYTVEVEEYLKAPKNYNTDTRTITVVSPGLRQYKDSQKSVIYDKIFNVGDRVLFLLYLNDGKLRESLYSLTTKSSCTPKQLLDEMYGPSGLSISQNNQSKHLYTNNPVDLTFYVYNRDLASEKKDFEFAVFTPNGKLSEKRQVQLEECKRSSEVRWSFIPTIQGKYAFSAIIGNNDGGSQSFGGVLIENYVDSPLKQYKAESREGITCQSGLELLRKASNGFTTCVKPQTKVELVKRGWGSETWPFSSIVKNKASCNITPEIMPGPYPLQSCPATSNQITTTILNSTGFASIHRANILAFADDYVLEPGHNGTITYSLGLSDAVLPDWLGDLPSRNTNLTNYAQFIHYKTLDLKELENYPDTILKKDSTSFATCFETPYDPSCIGELTTSNTVNAFVYDHPGVTVHFDKQYELLTKGQNVTLAVTFSASKDAVPGTYVVILPQGMCSGGMILLTIGDCPYQVNAK